MARVADEFKQQAEDRSSEEIGEIANNPMVIHFDTTGRSLIHTETDGVINRKSTGSEEILWSKTIYGDDKSYSATSTVLHNQKAKIARIYDQSGIRTYDHYDFRDLKINNRLAYTKIHGEEERYEYDVSGSIIAMSGYSKIEWDAFGRLKSSSRQRLKPISVDEGETDDEKVPDDTWFNYNSDDDRVRKVTDRSSLGSGTEPWRLKETLYFDCCDIYLKYIGKRMETLLEEIDVETHTSLVKEHPSARTPVVRIEKTVSEAPSSWLLRWTLSPSLEMDDQAIVVSYEEYTPFGLTTMQLCSRGIEAPSRYRFASYLRDHETGLYYCQARYYCPWLGRWLSPDPLDTTDSLNLHYYVGNDPPRQITFQLKKSLQVLQMRQYVGRSAVQAQLDHWKTAVAAR
ncbi:hypothetical protein V8C42DRAFT_341684 [Trichoderma barbatum]